MDFHALYPAIQAHALVDYPKEACGIVEAGAYHSLANLSPNPETAFRMDLRGHRPQALVHSHPDGIDGPSSYDMRQQSAMGIPWIIVKVTAQGCKAPFVLGGPPAPLIGRTFRHGVHDCYALIQDWFSRQGQRHLTPEMPRDWRWWEQGKNLYLDHYQGAGWEPTSDPQVGAIGLVQTAGSPVPNHAGVLIPDGWFLHHLVGKFSLRERAEAWLPMIRLWLSHPSFIYQGP